MRKILKHLYRISLSLSLMVSPVLLANDVPVEGDSVAVHALASDLASAGLGQPPARNAALNGWEVQTTRHFLLVGADPRHIGAMGILLERTHETFHRTFARCGIQPGGSHDRLSWIVFKDRRQFEQYARKVDRVDMSWSDGYYSTRTNRVAVFAFNDDGNDFAMDPGPRGVDFLDASRTTHEAAHQLAFNSGLQKRGVMYPLWIAEGLATNFEQHDDSAIGPEEDNPHRRTQFAQTYRHDRIIPLRDFVRMSRPAVGDAVGVRDAYAQSWAFFRFIYATHPDPLNRYLRQLRAMAPGKREADRLLNEFTHHFGSVEAMEREWSLFVGQMMSGK